jgi:DNA polymerase-4
VAVKIRYPDFKTYTKQLSINPSHFDDELMNVVRDLFIQLYDGKTSLRLIGVRYSELVEKSMQTDLFDNKIKKEKLYSAFDGVKKRFGKGSIGRGKNNEG